MTRYIKFTGYGEEGKDFDELKNLDITPYKRYKVTKITIDGDPKTKSGRWYWEFVDDAGEVNCMASNTSAAVWEEVMTYTVGAMVEGNDHKHTYTAADCDHASAIEAVKEALGGKGVVRCLALIDCTKLNRIQHV